jgi:hypothetical protein
MKTQISEEELFFGLCILDTSLFAELYFYEDIKLGLSTKQKVMFLDESDHKLLCCGRKCAKTVYIEVMLLKSALTMRGEGMFFTPGAAHLTPVRARIASKINQSPLFSTLLDSFNKNDGIMSFRRGAFVWHWRIEGTDGTDKNMVGLRAQIIIGDELAFGCLPSDTDIYTTDKPVKIKDISIGQEIIGFDGFGISKTKVIGKKYSGNRSVLEISTATRKIRATDNHPFLVAKKTKVGKQGSCKTCSSEWDMTWVRADELEEGDFVVVSKSTPRGLSRIRIGNNLAFDRVRKIKELEPEDTWDIETECNNFIANGIVVHNSMVCHQSRGQVALPKCRWIYAGVPNAWHSGILYALDQTKMGDSWSKHRLTSYDNPLYNGREQELVDLYRGRGTWEYQTQVLGQWGGELERSFPPGAIAIKEGIPFYAHDFIANLISANTNEITRLLRIPRIDAKNYIIGIDYGFSPDPTELLIFYEKGEDEWVELSRIRMKAVIAAHQGIVVHMINQYLDFKVRAICVEYVSGGVGIVQELQRTDTNLSPGLLFPYAEVCVNANPGGAIEVPSITLPTTDQMTASGIPDFSYASQELANEQGLVRVYRKVWMTHLLRDAMVRANQNIIGTRLWISGQDLELQESIMNILEKKTAGGNTIYDKIDKTIPDHPADAARCAVCAIEHFNSKRNQVEESESLGFLGWAGKQTANSGTWRSPWR